MNKKLKAPFKFLLYLTVAILLQACGTLGVVEKTTSLPPKNESIFILGVSPPLANILVFPADRVGGSIKQNSWRVAAVAGRPDNGFLVGKASEGELLALFKILLYQSEDSLAHQSFGPCNGVRAMAFQIPGGGKVIYIGHVEFQISGSKLIPKYSQDIASAKQYIDANYPALRGSVEPWDFELLPSIEPCHTTVRIPIYLPSR